jgi:hypothetical protein
VGKGGGECQVPVYRRTPTTGIMLDVDDGLRFNQQAAYVNMPCKSSHKQRPLIPGPDE